VLPLALLSLIGARLALGPDDRALPIVVFLASAIVQTHVGFAPQVIAMIALPLVVRGCRLVESARSELHPASRRHRLIALGILISMWALPLYEAATANPGNLQRLVAFFAPGALGQHSWNEAATTVLDQSAVMPFALARTLRPFQGTSPHRAVWIVAGIQFTAVGAILAVAGRRRHNVLTVLATIPLVQTVVAGAAVRAIRGPIEPYLVIWVSLTGFFSVLAVSC